MKRRKSKFRSILWSSLIIVGFIVSIGIYISIQPVISKVRFLKEFDLPAAMVFDIEEYSYWNDFMKYTDGYEIIELHVDAEKWEMPDIWNAGKATLSEILEPHGLGYSSALGNEMEQGEIPLNCEGWFISENNQVESKSDREFFIGTYDGEGSLFLYRGHHLYGDADLRLTGK